MKVYQVYKDWTDDDGWSKGTPSLMKTFTTEKRAREYMYGETGLHSAIEFGYAEVISLRSLYRWSIRKVEVEE